METFKQNLNSNYAELREIPENVTLSCCSEDARVGWYHVCTATDDNGNELATARVQYYNRTWESYTYQSVIQSCLRILKDIEYRKENGVSIDEEFLDRLRDDDYITDYGYDMDGDLTVLFDTWEQREKVWDKLEALAEQNKLSTDINYTVQKAYVVFTDEYTLCSECGQVVKYENCEFSDYSGYLCPDCAGEDTDLLQEKISEAQEDFRKAITSVYDKDTVESLGYTGFDGFRVYEYEDYTDVNFAQEIMSRYEGTFAYIDGSYQFCSDFSIFVCDEYADKVGELIERYKDGESIDSIFYGDNEDEDEEDTEED